MTRKIERIIFWVIIIEALLKIIGIHFPGQSQLFILSFMAISGMYFVGGVVLFNSGGDFNFKGSSQPVVDDKGSIILDAKGNMIFKSSNDIAGSALLGVAMSLAIIGLLFSLFFWPNSGQFWLMALGISIALVTYLIVKMQSKDTDKAAQRKFLLARAVVVLIFSLVFYVTPRYTILRIVHRDKSEEYLDKFQRTLDHPENAAYRKDWEEYRKKLDSIDRAK